MKIDLLQLDFVHWKLKEIALDVERHFNVEFTITSLYRDGDTGVHGTIPVRGLDLSCRDEKMGLAVEDYVNDTWTYDPARIGKLCCLYHGDAPHLHLQAHPNTVKS